MLLVHSSDGLATTRSRYLLSAESYCIIRRKVVRTRRGDPVDPRSMNRSKFREQVTSSEPCLVATVSIRAFRILQSYRPEQFGTRPARTQLSKENPPLTSASMYTEIATHAKAFISRVPNGFLFVSGDLPKQRLRLIRIRLELRLAPQFETPVNERSQSRSCTGFLCLCRLE